MPELPGPSIASAIRAFAARLKFPQLFALVASLFVVDLIVPDFIPLIDEILLGLLTLMLGMWQATRGPEPQPPPERPPEKDITPKDR